MGFGKIVNGEFVSCPQNGYLSTGEAVSNLPELLGQDEEIRILEGCKVVSEDVQPIFAEGEYLETVYTEDDNNIYRHWEVRQHG